MLRCISYNRHLHRQIDQSIKYCDRNLHRQITDTIVAQIVCRISVWRFRNVQIELGIACIGRRCSGPIVHFLTDFPDATIGASVIGIIGHYLRT